MEYLSIHSTAYFQLPFIMPHISLYFHGNHPLQLAHLEPLNIPLGFLTILLFYSLIPLTFNVQTLPWHPFPIQILPAFVSVSSQLANALPREWIVLLFLN